jgi:hypothetical protein
MTTTEGTDNSKHNDAAPAFNASTVRGSEGTGAWWEFWGTSQSQQSPDESESRRRQRAELYLAHFFLETVMKNGREIVNQRRGQILAERGVAGGASSRRPVGEVTSSASPHAAVAAANELTEDEQKVFRRTEYYGRTEGAAAGLTTFGVLFGSLRWAASRRGGGGGLGRTGAQLAMMPPPPRRGYQQLDGISSRRSALSKAASVPGLPMPSSPSSTTSTPLLGASDDVMTELQFMCVGAMSLMVGILAVPAGGTRPALTGTEHPVP